jgi:muramidase (phage lysozyme)
MLQLSRSKTFHASHKHNNLKKDRKRRTEEVSTVIQALLDTTLTKQVNAKQAYDILHRWYKHYGDHPMKPS